MGPAAVSQAAAKATIGNQVQPHGHGIARSFTRQESPRNADSANEGVAHMKGTIFVLVVGLGFGFLACPLASAQTVFDDPNATNVAVNAQPMPESASLRSLEPLPGSADNQVSATDATGMQEAIDKFKFLFEGGNADRLKHDIWPSMSPKQYRALKNAFKVVSQVSLQETCPGSPAVASDLAEWTCTER